MSSAASRLGALTAPSLQRAGRTDERAAYARILQGTALIGGSSLVNVGFAILRGKAMALMLGPGGVGLMGALSAIADLAASVAGMGIQNSGVRQIADAAASGDQQRVARAAIALKWTTLGLGGLGAVCLIPLATPISILTFGQAEHTAAVALLSLAVLCRVAAAGHTALVQGFGRVADLARINVLAGLCSTAVAVPVVFLFREQGIAASLVLVAALGLATSWWYSRRVPVAALPQHRGIPLEDAMSLLKLGAAFMASGLLTMAAAYAVRTIVLRKAGLDAAGLYQAAWAVGGMYAGLVLQAMGADFFPRLTAAARDHEACNRLVNQQAQVSILLAAPGLIATIALAWWIVPLFYSAEFGGSVETLRWICLGMALRVLAWPMGFIVLAKGAQGIFFWTEVAATVVHVVLAWVLVERFGVAGAGMAFCGLYVWHGLFIYAIVGRLTGFRWRPANLRLGGGLVAGTAAAFALSAVARPATATVVGLTVAAVSAIYAIRHISRVLLHQGGNT